MHDEHAAVEHRAILYHDDDTFVAEVDAFVQSGLLKGEHVIVALAANKLGMLREQLGRDADAVQFADSEALYERHGEMFASILGYLDRHREQGGGGVRIVAEQALSRRSPTDVRAYMRYEAASNLAYRAYGASVACPYDAARLSDAVLEAALCTHPGILDRGRSRPNERFVDPREFVREHVVVPNPPAGAEPYVLERLEDLAHARALIRARAQAAGLSGRMIEDLCIAVSEVAANALLHGSAPRRLWTFVVDGFLVCQVGDGGSGLTDPLVGYVPPPPGQIGGRGLWIAHQLCDVVEIASRTARTCVSLYMRLQPAR